MSATVGSPTRTCILDDCDRRVLARSLCSLHYERAKVAGTLDAYPVKTRAVCSIDGCDRISNARGYCKTHYSRWRNHGDATIVKRAPAGSGCLTHNGYRIVFRPDHPLARGKGYVEQHRVVLFDAIGPGSHPCHWCGETVEWTYGTPDGALVVDHLDGQKDHNELSNLVPSCGPCNSHRDMEAVA